MTPPVVICHSEQDAAAVREAILAALFRRGERAHSSLRSVVIVVINDHSPSFATNHSHGDTPHVHDGFMSYAEVSKLTGLSKSTIARRVKVGILQRDGRRLTTDSVRRWIEGGTP